MISPLPWKLEKEGQKIFDANGEVIAENYIFKNLDDFEAIPKLVNQGAESGQLDTVVSDNFDPKKDNEYAYKTIGEYEEILEHRVNDAFRIGWDMTRTKNKHLRQLVERSR